MQMCPGKGNVKRFIEDVGGHTEQAIHFWEIKISRYRM